MSNNAKALIVIDMQKGSFTEETPRYDTEEVIDRINKLAAKFRNENSPVIFIQHDGTAESAFIPNSWEWEILDGLMIDKNDSIVSKTANDAFYNSVLFEKLRSHNVAELYITGCATDFCVEATIQSALTKDFSLTVVADAHTTGERPNLSAKQVIDHYNWVWSHMIPTKGKIAIYSAKQLLEKG